MKGMNGSKSVKREQRREVKLRTGIYRKRRQQIKQETREGEKGSKSAAGRERMNAKSSKWWFHFHTHRHTPPPPPPPPYQYLFTSTDPITLLIYTIGIRISNHVRTISHSVGRTHRPSFRMAMLQPRGSTSRPKNQVTEFQL